VTSERPTTLLAELTHRCPLHCPYCSNPLDLIRAEKEISTEDWKRVITEARALGVLQLGLSGGEPLVRKDTEELAAHARGLGLYSTLVTSGLGLTRARAEKFREAGLEHIQISLQDADDDNAERIAGVRSVKQKRAAAALVRELGFAFTVNVLSPGSGDWSKVAITSWSSSSRSKSTSQVVPLHSPPQPLNVQPEAGAAVNVTVPVPL